MTTVTVTTEVEVEVDLSEIDAAALQEELKSRNILDAGGGDCSELLDQIYYALRDNDVEALKRHSGTLIFVTLGRIV